MTGRLEGSRVLVTGAAGGIGAGIARLAAEGGAGVLLVDVREEPLVALAERLGGEAHVMDVADAASWSALAGSTGRWDYVFLNAGIMSTPPEAPLGASDFLTLDPERYRRILAVNIDGVAFGLRAAVPRMREGGGAIVVTASVAGLIPYPPDPAYALTKHAVVGLVRSLAPTLVTTDGSPELRLCAICPGGVETDLVPAALRGVTPMMDPSTLAAEALDLCLKGGNGEVRTKIKADEPARVVRAPQIALL
jgi:NAD(P)-dependent dehydrogenase (short-subunit alcohol dehydrogenase family)